MEKKFDPDREGDFNREDSDTAKRPRKSASSEESVSSPFARDKRPRIRRVTEELNERTPRPRVERDGGERSPYPRENRGENDRTPFRRNDEERRPYRDNRGGEERRPYERRPDNRSDYRSSDSPDEPRRRSYNPNFDEDNRVRRPAPRRDHDDRNPEEDNRFNSYNYDRERPQRDDNRPRYQNDRQSQGNRPGYGSRDNNQGYRDNRGYGQRDNRDNRDNRDSRDNRGYGQRDNRGYGNRDNNRSYQPRDDRNNRPAHGDRRPPRDNRPAGQQRPNDPFKTPKGGYDSAYKPKVYPAYAAANIVEPIRLNKFISMSGLCSRREADEFIKEGNVTVNGQVITEMGVKINPADEVRFNGEQLQGEKRVYILMNKPKGFVTTVEDPNAERTVMDIVQNACKERVYPVGRLDKNSLGVLLITNDGELTKKLTHPSHEKQKVYQVTLDRKPVPEELSRLLDGIELDDGVAKADEIDILDMASGRDVGITIHTGRNRIVRRMFEELGYHVQKLDRVYFAGLTKKGLRRGAWRYLTPKEVAMLKSGSYE